MKKSSKNDFKQEKIFLHYEKNGRELSKIGKNLKKMDTHYTKK